MLVVRATGQFTPSTGARIVRLWSESGAGSRPNAPSGTLEDLGAGVNAGVVAWVIELVKA
jgi:hypothetical protein